MDSIAETIRESGKEWAKPELRKVDIEQITATGNSGSHNDGHFKSPNQS
jgi:hypothetical protein